MHVLCGQGYLSRATGRVTGGRCGDSLFQLIVELVCPCHPPYPQCQHVHQTNPLCGSFHRLPSAPKHPLEHYGWVASHPLAEHRARLQPGALRCRLGT